VLLHVAGLLAESATCRHAVLLVIFLLLSLACWPSAVLLLILCHSQRA